MDCQVIAATRKIDRILPEKFGLNSLTAIQHLFKDDFL